jgi:hypothetical protein
LCLVDTPVSPGEVLLRSGCPLFGAFVVDGGMDDDHVRSPEDDPLVGTLQVGFFDDALPAIAQGAVAAGDGDDDWFARAADGTPIVGERATAARETIGAAALLLDRELARRAPRRRRRSAGTSAERGGRHPRCPGRLVGAGVLALLVVLSLALVTDAPQSRGGAERSLRASSATTERALNNNGVAVARRRRHLAAVRRADRRVAPAGSRTLTTQSASATAFTAGRSTAYGARAGPVGGGRASRARGCAARRCACAARCSAGAAGA